MINKPLILLLLKKCKDFVRRNVLHGQPALETQAGVVQKLVKGIAIGMKLAGRVLHGHILYPEQDQCFPLPVGQFLVNNAADTDEHIGALGGNFGSGLRVGR